jgi:hypothetical protein
MFGFPDALCGRLLLWRRSTSPSEGDQGRQADARAHFWAQKRAAYRHILDLIEAGVVSQKWRSPFLHRPSKGIAVHKQADHDVMHLR